MALTQSQSAAETLAPNEIKITVKSDLFSHQAQATSPVDLFTFIAEKKISNLVAQINISNFTTGNRVDLSQASKAGFNTEVLGLTQPTDISITNGNLQVTLIDAPSLEDINTWIITFESVNQQIINAVESAANPQAAFTSIADIWGEGWITLVSDKKENSDKK